MDTTGEDSDMRVRALSMNFILSEGLKYELESRNLKFHMIFHTEGEGERERGREGV
jgi:hypothetical protein